MKILIIGGGAGGASCAARLRRLDNSAEITVFEKTKETSVASCGLPYYIGNIISERGKMQVAAPDLFKNLFNIDVKTECEITAVTPEKKTVTTADGKEYPYDKLVISGGAKPFVPPVAGLEKLPCFVVKHLSDADKIKDFIKHNAVKNAVVVGGGFIGVEVAENLNHLGIKTALVELSDQILPPLDHDMVRPVQQKMKDQGVDLYLSDGLKEITEAGLILNSGKNIPAEMVILAIGVRPDTDFLKQSGIKLSDRGEILTNEFMQTNIPDIYACGDNVAVTDFVSGQNVMIALAGPANRQGRLIADHIAGRSYPYKATQGTGIVKVFNLTAAFTGNNEKQLRRLNIPYEKMVVTSASHAGYYPDAQELTLKVLYDKDGKILGAQAVGTQGVDKRIDVIATVMRLNGTTQDLRDAELCYAPPYSSAKDPVNIIGMAIENAREGLVEPYFGTDFGDLFILDVRPAEMYQAEHIAGAVNIPAAQIRKRLDELPRDKTIMVHCVKGYTSYVVARILMQSGFKNVLSYAGGWSYYKKQK
ncbi:MAG: FAD-dependent oxidoreductase [Alphaproteobacteria bacterium]|nr:FAD-dependent oxidoreductase [Alphaproteobacteria bacterium]